MTNRSRGQRIGGSLGVIFGVGITLALGLMIVALLTGRAGGRADHAAQPQQTHMTTASPPVASLTISPTRMPTPKVTEAMAGWTTKTIGDVEYTMYLPRRMEVWESPNVTYFVLFGPKQGQGTDFHDGLMVVVTAYAKMNDDTLSVFADREIAKMRDPMSSYRVESVENVTIAGSVVVKVTGSSISCSLVQIFLQHKNNMLSVSGCYGGTDKHVYLDILNRMLSTLKLN